MLPCCNLRYSLPFADFPDAVHLRDLILSDCYVTGVQRSTMGDETFCQDWDPGWEKLFARKYWEVWPKGELVGRVWGPGGKLRNVVEEEEEWVCGPRPVPWPPASFSTQCSGRSSAPESSRVESRPAAKFLPPCQLGLQPAQRTHARKYWQSKFFNCQ